MKTIKVRNKCVDFNSYRSARVKSLFNADNGSEFNLDAEIDLDGEWSIGVVVGPSGSGKTSIGRQIMEGVDIYEPDGWPEDQPIIDEINRGGDFDEATGALSSVGLGSVPSWLRPYSVLSNGEKFRADLAKIICKSPSEVIIDEFTSVVDRQIAKFGAAAFQKSWRRTGGKCVLISCHYDVLEWLEPDWVFDTKTQEFARGSLWRRPRFDVEIFKTDKRYWGLFEPHYYLKLPSMIGAEYFVGAVDGEPVAHIAVSPHLHMNGVRASRMVVMPEFQGAGVGLRFLDKVLDYYVSGQSRYGGRVKHAYFHTSHPALCGALRNRYGWRQVSCKLYGGSKVKSAKSIKKSGGVGAGFGGHLRAAQGFKYTGSRTA